VSHAFCRLELLGAPGLLQMHLSQDAVAFLGASAVMVGLVELLKGLAMTGLYPSTLTRKLTHMTAGPVFLLTWPWFDGKPESKLWASAVPAAMTAKFALTGLGVIKNAAEVRLMSRTGCKEELLRGPLLYGVVFTVATILGFRTNAAAGALMALCAGDGMADVVGRRFGDTHKLPWSPRKSWAGSAAYVASSFGASLLFVVLFDKWGWGGNSTLSELLLPLLAASVASAAAESLPMADVDNVVSPAVFAAVLGVCAPSTMAAS